jgi:carboxylesterase
MPVADAMRAAGFEVDVPLLPGHGTTPDDLDGTTFCDWLAAAEESYDCLAGSCRRVGVVGLSMGGALACALAENHRDIAGVILVNPLIEPVAPSFVTLLTDALDAGTATIPSIGSDIARPGHPPTGGYDSTPVRPLLSLVRGIDTVAAHLVEIASPVLLFSSRNDHVVPVSTGEFLEATLRGPLERVMLERSFHVATLDYDAEAIVRRSVDFMERLAS